MFLFVVEIKLFLIKLELDKIRADILVSANNNDTLTMKEKLMDYDSVLFAYDFYNKKKLLLT
ncbi:hypothetical protein C0W59_22295 [Photobacterium kishitanii]|uniref:hypothetical protein n=1 Tax=Photobacterium kishitanii TaxID=318456 RepID=UPI000D15AE3E|nr:hypothetical protein [Photobacterium kishitanii]PSV09298.1 hypothetical protein C0W59_22295 [Photobacterium kishitanii]